MPLLALDVDGTLLTSTDTVSPRTRAALVRAADRGWHVVVVTGRPLEIALPVVHDLGVGEYIVAANGATVAEIESGQVLFQASLPGRLVADAIDRARRAVPGIGSAVLTARGFVHEPGFGVLAPLSDVSGTEVADARPHADDVVEGAVLYADADALELVARVAAVVPDGVSVSPSGLPGCIELTAPGVHKAGGLTHLCARIGVEPADVVAFGDGLNDHQMLTWAGRSVAMGNADDATKAVADEVTASNDHDGIALVVERLLDAP